MTKTIQVNSMFNEQWAKCEQELYAVEYERTKFIRDVQTKASELGGKVIMLHDEIILDLTTEQLLTLREWAETHPAPALAKRGFL